ncbi:MAG: HAMP domain-containing histidine kinase [Sulfuricella sp.]|nr:HAMP domain-containing histidine kinase [Sulfuricella sp.]
MIKPRLSYLIPLLLLLSSLLSASLLFFWEIRDSSQVIERESSDTVKTLLTQLQNMLDTQLADDNYEGARLSLSVSAMHPQIRTLLLTDENDAVVLANRYIWERNPATAVSGYVAASAGQVRQTQVHASAIDRARLLLTGYYPVTLKIGTGGQATNRIGVLYVEFDLSGRLAQARHKAVTYSIYFGALMLAIAAISAVLMHVLVSRRVKKLTAAARKLAAGDLDTRTAMRGQDELAELGQAFDHMAAQRQQAEATIHQLNLSLEARVREEVAKNREKDHIVIQHSRLAAMGEMIGNIAHQWRQPINTLGLILDNIRDAWAYSELTQDYLDEEIAIGRQLIDKMSTTIDDFRNFFRPNKEKRAFSLKQVVENTLSILFASLHNNNIDVEVEVVEDAQAYGFPNEFSQALLNIVNNAKDAIVAKHIENGFIRLSVSRHNGQAAIRINDNGGGIPAAVLPKIFDPYFTTKASGTGIGLYMSKMIVENNMNGRIEVVNRQDGAEFTLTCPLAGEPATTDAG